MEWEHYEEAKTRYIRTQIRYAELLAQKEEIFQKTQPNAVQFDRDVVTGSGGANPLEEYVIKLENLDWHLGMVASMMDNAAFLLKHAKEYLMESPDFRDKVYRMRFIQKMRVQRIAEIVHYSEATVWRTLRQIQKERKVDRK